MSIDDTTPPTPSPWEEVDSTAADLRSYLDEVDRKVDRISGADVASRLRKFMDAAPAVQDDSWLPSEMALLEARDEAEEILRKARERALEIELRTVAMQEAAAWHLEQAERLSRGIKAQADEAVEDSRRAALVRLRTARRQADALLVDAHKRAEDIIAEAHEQARSIIARAPVVVEVTAPAEHRPFAVLGGAPTAALRRHRVSRVLEAQVCHAAEPVVAELETGEAPAPELTAAELGAERRHVLGHVRNAYLWLVDCVSALAGERDVVPRSEDLASRVRAHLAEIDELEDGHRVARPQTERWPVFMRAPYELMTDRTGHGTLVPVDDLADTEGRIPC